VYLFVNFFCKHYYYDYDWNTIQGRVQRVPWNTSSRSLDKLLKMLGKLKSVYYHTIRFYNKTVTVTSLHWKLCYTTLIEISASKIIIVVLYHKLIQVMLEAFYRFNITGEWIFVQSTKSKWPLMSLLWTTIVVHDTVTWHELMGWTVYINSITVLTPHTSIIM